MITAVINQKGGAGKTTFAVHLATHLVDQGRRVAFVDNDPQGSAARWLTRGMPEIDCRTVVDARGLVPVLQELEEEYDDVVCDGAPRLNEQTHVLMYFADLILIPTRPTTLDLQATIETKQALDKVQKARQEDGRDPMDVHLLLNFVRTVGNLHTTVREALRAMDYPLAAASIGMRDAVAKAVTLQTTVQRMAAGGDKSATKAAEEFESLWRELGISTSNHHEDRNDIGTKQHQAGKQSRRKARAA